MKLTLFLKIRGIATAVRALPRNDTGIQLRGSAHTAVAIPLNVQAVRSTGGAGIQKHHFQTLKGLPGVGMTDAKRGRR